MGALDQVSFWGPRGSDIIFGDPGSGIIWGALGQVSFGGPWVRYHFGGPGSGIIWGALGQVSFWGPSWYCLNGYAINCELLL